MKRLLAALVVLFAITASSSSAFAWVKFKNNTSNTVWVTHAYASVYKQVCGFYDSCPSSDSSTAGWRVKGWWAMAPGGTTTVDGNAYHDAWRQYYADNFAGTYWGGGGRTFYVRNTAFSFCGNYSVGNYRRTFRPYSTSRCCGWGCSPDNYTMTLNP